MISEEQEALLTRMVEAVRRQPPAERQPFWIFSTASSHNYLLHHPGLPPNDPGAYPTDIDLLVGAGLLHRRIENGHATLDVTPKGFQHFAIRARIETASNEAVESGVRRFIESDAFARTYPDAAAKLRVASNEFWSSDDPSSWTRIGHVCREALQLFSIRLAERHGVASDADPAKTVARIRAVLQSVGITGARRAFGDALLAYWGTVSDLVQRQEHGAGKEGEALRLSDARRVIFQTMLVMYEISDFVDFSV